MRLLQKDVTELNTCNGNSAVLIENLKKENTILHISVAEKSLVGDYSLQVRLELSTTTTKSSLGHIGDLLCFP